MIDVSFPVIFEATVYLTDGYESAAKVTIPTRPGILPDNEKIQQIIAKAIEEVPGDFRPMGKREFIETMLYEETGERMSAAVDGEFDE